MIQDSHRTSNAYWDRCISRQRRYSIVSWPLTEIRKSRAELGEYEVLYMRLESHTAFVPHTMKSHAHATEAAEKLPCQTHCPRPSHILSSLYSTVFLLKELKKEGGGRVLFFHYVWSEVFFLHRWFSKWFNESNSSRTVCVKVGKTTICHRDFVIIFLLFLTSHWPDRLLQVCGDIACCK